MCLDWALITAQSALSNSGQAVGLLITPWCRNANDSMVLCQDKIVTCKESTNCNNSPTEVC